MPLLDHAVLLRELQELHYAELHYMPPGLRPGLAAKILPNKRKNLPLIEFPFYLHNIELMRAVIRYSPIIQTVGLNL